MDSGRHRQEPCILPVGGLDNRYEIGYVWWILYEEDIGHACMSIQEALLMLAHPAQLYNI